MWYRAGDSLKAKPTTHQNKGLFVLCQFALTCVLERCEAVCWDFLKSEVFLWGPRGKGHQSHGKWSKTLSMMPLWPLPLWGIFPRQTFSKHSSISHALCWTLRETQRWTKPCPSMQDLPVCGLGVKGCCLHSQEWKGGRRGGGWGQGRGFIAKKQA